MNKVDKKKAEVLEFLRKRIADGIPPSIREICAEMGFKSTCTAHKYLHLLEDDGEIELVQGSNRGIRMVGAPKGESVPLVGTVAAGTPILAQQNIEDYVMVDKAPAGELFALTVKGESMINVGIYDGDIIIVRQTPEARNGEIVVALIEDEATVKTFYTDNGRIRLQPENDTMDPIYPETCAILGKVVRLIRNY
jgi:repressor LexA